jgi:hypothetical protein
MMAEKGHLSVPRKAYRSLYIKVGEIDKANRSLT